MSATALRRADPWKDLLVIDARAPRFNQAVVALGALIAVLTGFWPLLTLLGVQLAATVLFGRQFCLACVAYFKFVQPRFGEGELEDSRAPRFANIIGAVFLFSATLAFIAGFPLVGTVLGGIVAALAGLATTTGFCAGCEVYKVIARLRGIKGGQLERIDLDDVGVNGATTVLFTHPLCSECHEVKAKFDAEGRAVTQIDVSKRKDLAKKYGVTLVPFVVSVGSDGRVVA